MTLSMLANRVFVVVDSYRYAITTACMIK